MEKNIESTRQLKVAKEIQKEMAEIIFYLDSSLDYVEHIEELLKK